jgi:hypothetical protein
MDHPSWILELLEAHLVAIPCSQMSGLVSCKRLRQVCRIYSVVCVIEGLLNYAKEKHHCLTLPSLPFVLGLCILNNLLIPFFVLLLLFLAAAEAAKFGRKPAELPGSDCLSLVDEAEAAAMKAKTRRFTSNLSFRACAFEMDVLCWFLF